jgi:hypothetical protein
MMLDSPHTSAPMLMRGNALVLKTPVENAPRTSIEKHLSWSSDIPPAACFQDNEVSQCCVMPLSGELNGISQALYVVVGIPLYVGPMVTAGAIVVIAGAA